MNNYQLNDEIGKGSYSSVYKGRRRNTIDYYAISSIEKARRPYVLNSVQTLRTLNHTNVIRFHNWYETNNHLWVIAEYCTGGDLKSIIAQEEKLSDSSVRAFGGDIANGLAFMHSQGILNNDLKPSNLLMDATATLRYYDFSLSCTFEKAADRPLVGSPLYMAPELFLMGRPASSMASDMWSFGCVLYEMTTGTPCFNGATLSELITSILTKPFKPIAGANPHLNNILKTTLEKNPFQRATWADIAASPYWENQLNLPTSFPPQPAFDALKSSYSKNTVDTRTAVARAVQTQTGEVRSSGRLSVDGTANVETNFDKETNFADLAPTAAAVSNGDSKAEESANTSKLANRRPSQRANSLPGKGTSDNDTNAVPNRRGATMAQKQYQSATSGTTRKLSGGTDDRFTKLQIDAFNGGAFAKINIESVLSHTSDAHIRPLCMNNRIEHYVEKQYNAQTLTFKPLTLKEVKALNGTELTQFVTTIYKPLSSSSVSHEDKLNIMRYFEGICPDATTANILVNSSVMTLCVKLAGQMDAPAVFRETAASIMGILVRHTTFIHVDLAKSNVVPNTVKLCKKETDMGVKRKLIACVGEFLFYVAVRPEKERDPWNIDAKEVKEVFLDALLSNDEIYKHYAAKAVENLGSVGDKHVIRFAFCSKDVVEALINVYTDSSPGSKADHMRSSGLCAAIKLTFVEDSLIPVVLNSTKLPTSSYGNLLHNTSIHRTAQLLLAFLNYALIRAMVTTKNPYVASWASLHPESPCLAPCLLSNADAENVLSEIGDRSDELLEGICDGLESYSLSSRGKTLLFATLIGCLGGTTFSRLASSRHVALLDKIMREQDKYVVQCSNVFSNYVSLFISEKLSFVAQKVSSSVTPFYLSALQQLLNMNTLRSMISLQRDAFKSLSECLEKSITNTMYGAYEDAFNAISDRLVQTPEAVVQYYSPIAMYLVKPYTEMLQQKESERRFSAIRYLTSIITPLSSEPRLSKDTIVIRAATSVVNVVIDNFSTLLGEMNPVPSSSVRLLVTCGEWMPKLLVPKLSEDFLKSLFQYLNTAREIDLSPPLNLIYLALFNGGKEEFLTYILQENIVSFIVKSLSNAHSKGIDNVVDACCELAAYLLKKVAGDPTSKNAQHCLELLSNNSIKNIYLPLCSSETKSTAESCACIMYDLTRLSPSAQAEMLSSDGVTTLIWALNSSPLPQVPEFLLKAMRHSVENQKTDIQKINSVDELVTALSNYNSSAGTNKNRNGIVEASKLIKLIKN